MAIHGPIALTWLTISLDHASLCGLEFDAIKPLEKSILLFRNIGILLQSSLTTLLHQFFQSKTMPKVLLPLTPVDRDLVVIQLPTARYPELSIIFNNDGMKLWQASNYPCGDISPLFKCMSSSRTIGFRTVVRLEFNITHISSNTNYTSYSGLDMKCLT